MIVYLKSIDELREMRSFFSRLALTQLGELTKLKGKGALEIADISSPYNGIAGFTCFYSRNRGISKCDFVYRYEPIRKEVWIKTKKDKERIIRRAMANKWLIANGDIRKGVVDVKSKTWYLFLNDSVNLGDISRSLYFKLFVDSPVGKEAPYAVGRY